MKKVIIYFDEYKKCYQIITPFKQSGRKDEMFDGNWQKLVDHVTRSFVSGDGRYVRNYYKYEVI